MGQKELRIRCTRYPDDYVEVDTGGIGINDGHVYIEVKELDRKSHVRITKQDAIALAKHILEITK
jgi:hypothetical protein